MQKILEALYGNLDSECTAPGREREKRDDFIFADLQRTVLDRLGEGGAGLLNEYDAAKDAEIGHEITETFIRGFRLGVRLMAAAFDDEYR